MWLEMEIFEVTFLDDDDSEVAWCCEAATPEDALGAGRIHMESKHGTYSVWDPRDPHGMPLLERTVG